MILRYLKEGMAVIYFIKYSSYPYYVEVPLMFALHQCRLKEGYLMIGKNHSAMST